MANRHWVGGTGNYSNTARWSDVSGGIGGFSVPVSTDDVIIDSNSGTGTITIGADYSLNNFTFNSSTIVVDFDFTFWTVTITGNFYTSAGALLTCGGATFTNSNSPTLKFASPSGAKTITTNGVLLPYMALDSAGGTIELQDELNLVSIVPTSCVFNSNNYNINSLHFYTVTAGVRTFNLGTSTLSLDAAASVWTIGVTTDLTFTGTYTIKFTNTTNTAITVTLVSSTWYNIWFNRGASIGQITITGSNTINNIRDTGTAAHTFRFAAAATNSIASWSINGTAGNLITIKSSATALTNLVKTGGGVVSADYLAIQNIAATPSNTWYAGTNSTNNQGIATAGSGWIFTSPPGTFGASLFFSS